MQQTADIVTLPEEDFDTSAAHQVDRYYSRWDLDSHDGQISFYDVLGRHIGYYTFKDPVEFGIAIDLLRNERPVYYNTTTRKLYTGSGWSQAELVGEEES